MRFSFIKILQKSKIIKSHKLKVLNFPRKPPIILTGPLLLNLDKKAKKDHI